MVALIAKKVNEACCSNLKKSK